MLMFLVFLQYIMFVKYFSLEEQVSSGPNTLRGIYLMTQDRTMGERVDYCHYCGAPDERLQSLLLGLNSELSAHRNVSTPSVKHLAGDTPLSHQA